MERKRLSKKVERSPRDRARIRETREHFERNRPSLDDLLACGDYAEPVNQGDFSNVLEFAAELKKARQARRLSLAQVASRSGIDKAAISRIENGQNPNPTVATLETLARSIGARLRLSLESAASPAR